MPIIAPIRESTFLQPNNPVPVSSSEDARIAGESISRAGGGIVNLGAGLSEFFEKTDKMNRENTVKAFSEWSRTQSMKDYATAVTSDTTPDGSGMVPAFEKTYGESVREKAKEIKDDITRQAAINAAMDHKNDRLATMIPESMKRRLEYGFKLNEQIINDKAAFIQANPDSHDREYQDYLTHLDIQRNDLGPQAEQIHEIAKRTFARSALGGLKSSGRFDEARTLLAEKYGMFLDAKNGEVEKEKNEIDSAEIQWANRKYAEGERQRQDAERKLKEQKEQNAATLFRLSMNAKTPADREKVVNLAGQLYGSRLLEESAYNFVTTATGKRVDVKDDMLLVQYMNRAMSGENYTRLRKEIVTANKNEKFSSDNTVKMLNMLKEFENKSKSDPNYTLRLQTAKKRLDYTFGEEGLVNLFPENWHKQKQLVLQEWTDLVTLQNVDPGIAANKVIEKYKPKSDSVPVVPGANPNENYSSKGLDNAARRFEDQFMKGVISEQELRKRKAMLLFRKRVLEEEGK